MKAVVTGGAGFIGSHLVERLLDDGYQVLVLDNFSTGRSDNLAHLASPRGLTIQECDVAKDDVAQFLGAGDLVFHIAALADIVPSIQHPDLYFRSNVQGTFNVVRAAQKAGVRKLVYAASSSCYGLPDIVPTPETAAIRPQYPYALTKFMAEEIVLHWALVYKLPAISLRLFNVYGPRSRSSGTYGAVFGVFLAQKLAGEPFTVVGDGTQTRDFTFVTDVVDAFVRAAEGPWAGEAYNVGSGATYSVNHLVKLLGGAVVHIPKRPGEPDCTFADTTKIAAAMGWASRVSFEAGVEQMLANIDYWREAPVWKPADIAQATKEWFECLT